MQVGRFGLRRERAGLYKHPTCRLCRRVRFVAVAAALETISLARKFKHGWLGPLGFGSHVLPTLPLKLYSFCFTRIASLHSKPSVRAPSASTIVSADTQQAKASILDVHREQLRA